MESMNGQPYARPRGQAAVAAGNRALAPEPSGRPLHSFHMRKPSEEPTEFGYFLMRKMAEHEPPLSQAALSRQTGVGQATISRWIFKPGRPEAEKLQLLARVLDTEYETLLTIAGYGEPSKDITKALSGLRVDVHPLAAELSAMLAPDSALSEMDRDLLRQMVDRMMDPHRRSMRVRRTA